MALFKVRIPIDETGSAEFSFDLIYSIDGPKYFVSVVDASRGSHYFSMVRDGGEWVIQNMILLPSWITALQSQLSATIHSNGKNY
jgi:hypothetical protein